MSVGANEWPMSDLPKPDFARNMRIVGHSDQGGRPDGVQVMVHRGHAYVGHMFSKGFSVIDVSVQKNPRAANYLPAPPGTWNIHLQTHGDLLLVIQMQDAEINSTNTGAYGDGVAGDPASGTRHPKALQRGPARVACARH